MSDYDERDPMTRIADALEAIIEMVQADHAKDAAEEAKRQAEYEACPEYDSTLKRCRYCGGTHVAAGVERA